MKLIVPDPDDRIVRAARSYGMKVSPGTTFEGQPKPWIALEVTSMVDAVPVSWLDFDKIFNGTVLVGYTPSGLPDEVLEMATLVAYVEQFDDAARLTRDQALAVFLHEAYQYAVKKRRRS